MTLTKREGLYQRGLMLLNRHRYAEAAAQFECAILLEQQEGTVRPSMRFRSYYAVSKALSNKLSHDDVELCEQAAATNSFDPILQLNLGWVYVHAGKTTKALTAFRRGLALDPANEQLRRAFAKTDRRGKPVLSLLARDHLLNKSLGRLRASLFGSTTRDPSLRRRPRPSPPDPSRAPVVNR